MVVIVAFCFTAKSQNKQDSIRILQSELQYKQQKQMLITQLKDLQKEHKNSTALMEKRVPVDSMMLLRSDMQYMQRKQTIDIQLQNIEKRYKQEQSIIKKIAGPGVKPVEKTKNKKP